MKIKKIKWWKDGEKRSLISSKISRSLSGRKKGDKIITLSTLKKKTELADDNCWVWQKSVDHKGYGRITLNKKQWSTHRLAYFISKGNILKNMCVCHSCKNPGCINPEHLFLGDLGEKMYSRSQKNTNSLSEKDRKDIYQLYSRASYSEETLAKQYKTSVTVIESIIKILSTPSQ